MIVRARAPLRLSLAGGGTDVSPYCDIYGGYVLNATIDRYAYSVIKELDEPKVRFVATDLQVAQENPLLPEFELTGELDLHRAIYNYIIRRYNNGEPLAIELSTFCDAPAGSGLGSSSTLVVSMLKAFVELLNLPIDDYEMARVAFQIEREDCNLAGGRQDQYAATFGGFNFMEFHKDERAIINPLRVKNWILCELEAQTLLFYTGVSRESAQIISDQSNNVKINSSDVIEAMHRIKQEAFDMKENLLKGDFEGILNSMRQGWENKKKTSSVISNPLIEEIYSSAIAAGAQAGKVSGAGGGGFMMFFVPPSKRMDVVRALSAFEGEIRNCHFTHEGSQAWRLL